MAGPTQPFQAECKQDAGEAEHAATERGRDREDLETAIKAAATDYATADEETPERKAAQKRLADLRRSRQELDEKREALLLARDGYAERVEQERRERAEKAANQRRLEIEAARNRLHRRARRVDELADLLKDAEADLKAAVNEFRPLVQVDGSKALIGVAAVMPQTVKFRLGYEVPAGGHRNVRQLANLLPDVSVLLANARLPRVEAETE